MTNLEITEQEVLRQVMCELELTGQEATVEQQISAVEAQIRFNLAVITDCEKLIKQELNVIEKHELITESFVCQQHNEMLNNILIKLKSQE